MAHYAMKYRKPSSSAPRSVSSTTVSANSESEAKDMIKRRNGEDVIFVSCIKK